MKFYLLILVFALFVGIGIFIYFRYYFRYILYKDLSYVCKHLKNNISFKKENVNILLQDAYSHISRQSRDLFSNFKNNNTIIYKKEDVENAKKFIESLGKGDVKFEINNINFYENNFEELRKSSYELLNKNGVMYIKLMVGIGLAVCIMLI
ncbi:MAG: stage III sporulation protein AB [Christensenellales bacterium]